MEFLDPALRDDILTKIRDHGYTWFEINKLLCAYDSPFTRDSTRTELKREVNSLRRKFSNLYLKRLLQKQKAFLDLKISDPLGLATCEPPLTFK